MAKPTDIRVAAAELFFLPVETRMPLKFGPETLTQVTCARARLTVRLASGGTAIGGEVIVNTIQAGDQKHPDVDVADDGSYVITWAGVDADLKGIFAQRFDADGVAVGGEFQVNTYTSTTTSGPAGVLMRAVAKPFPLTYSRLVTTRSASPRNAKRSNDTSSIG